MEALSSSYGILRTMRSQHDYLLLQCNRNSRICTEIGVAFDLAKLRTNRDIGHIDRGVSRLMQPANTRILRSQRKSRRFSADLKSVKLRGYVFTFLLRRSTVISSAGPRFQLPAASLSSIAME